MAGTHPPASYSTRSGLKSASTEGSTSATLARNSASAVPSGRPTSRVLRALRAGKLLSQCTDRVKARGSSLRADEARGWQAVGRFVGGSMCAWIHGRGLQPGAWSIKPVLTRGTPRCHPPGARPDPRSSPSALPPPPGEPGWEMALLGVGGC